MFVNEAYGPCGPIPRAYLARAANGRPPVAGSRTSEHRELYIVPSSNPTQSPPPPAVQVVDSASEALRLARGRLKALEARIAGTLKGYLGEVSERGGRMCVAAPAGARRCCAF